MHAHSRWMKINSVVRVCYGGFDLSSTTDITAFVLCFPPLDEDDKYCIMPFFWIPEENLQDRVNRKHVPYDIWERKGKMQTTEGNVIHYGFIEKFIENLGGEIQYPGDSLRQMGSGIDGTEP